MLGPGEYFVFSTEFVSVLRKQYESEAQLCARAIKYTISTTTSFLGKQLTLNLDELGFDVIKND